jgi:hypothetical protein
MTEPTRPRPVPGPPRPGPGPGPAGSLPPGARDTRTPVPGPAGGQVPVPGPAPDAAQPTADAGGPFAALPARPVAEHVAVFEEEHARLQRELGTIDQL